MSLSIASSLTACAYCVGLGAQVAKVAVPMKDDRFNGFAAMNQVVVSLLPCKGIFTLLETLSRADGRVLKPR